MKAKKIMALFLTLMLALSLATAAFADENHPEDVMQPAKTVYAIGTQSYYKLEADGSIVFADREEDADYEAVPSAYIEGSSYNKENTAYGFYLTLDGKLHVVALSVCVAEADGSYTFRHGTSDSATVSTTVDTATNADPEMSTEFYINIENGIDPDGTTSEDVVPGVATGDPRINYDITVATKATYQLNATVPMYVCMYGYRGTGNVVTPTSDAYQLKNYSTQNNNTAATIVDIAKVTTYTQLIDTDHSDEELYAIAFDSTTGEYKWWYSEPATTPTDENYTVITDKAINASGECFVVFMDGAYSFKVAGMVDADSAFRETVTAIDPAHPLTADFVYGGWNFGTEFAVGDAGTGTVDAVEGMAIKVTELQAQPATWRLVPISTGANGIKRGELAMTIAPVKASANASAIDLANCSAKLDINENGWILAAPAVQADGTVADADATTLGIITKAQMAGGNVNDAGCTSVVKVTYTVTPLFVVDGAQTEVISNRTA